MYDVFLGGSIDTVWRSYFKKKISNDISVFDPEDPQIEVDNSTEKIARDLYFIQNAILVVFYISESTNLEEMITIGIEIADSVARSKQVLVSCTNKHCGFLSHYCDYHGVLNLDSLDDLIVATEDYFSQISRCESDECKNEED